VIDSLRRRRRAKDPWRWRRWMAGQGAGLIATDHDKPASWRRSMSGCSVPAPGRPQFAIVRNAEGGRTITLTEIHASADPGPDRCALAREPAPGGRNPDAKWPDAPRARSKVRLKRSGHSGWIARPPH